MEVESCSLSEELQQRFLLGAALDLGAAHFAELVLEVEVVVSEVIPSYIHSVSQGREKEWDSHIIDVSTALLAPYTGSSETCCCSICICVVIVIVKVNDIGGWTSRSWIKGASTGSNDTTDQGFHFIIQRKSLLSPLIELLLVTLKKNLVSEQGYVKQNTPQF